MSRRRGSDTARRRAVEGNGAHRDAMRPALWLGVLLMAGGFALSGCGSGGNVYVGVGVAGPWVGPAYPGYYPRPPMYGPPRCCWDEDADIDDGDVLETIDGDAIPVVEGVALEIMDRGALNPSDREPEVLLDGSPARESPGSPPGQGEPKR